MSHLPGEGVSPNPQPDPEEVIRSLEDRLAAIAADMGRLAVEMTDITAELAARRAEQSGDQNIQDTGTESANPPIIELYSRAEDDASQPIEYLEKISALNADLPQRIQDMFAPTLSGFSANVHTRVQPAEDLRLNGGKPRRKPLTALPDYSEDPKEWRKMVDKYAQRHQWTEVERQYDFRARFTVDYVSLANGEKELVGYGFTSTKGEYPLLKDEEIPDFVANIVCADNLVRKAAFTYYRKNNEGDHNYHPETTTYDFTDNTIEVRGGYENRMVFSTYRYVPEEYRYELMPHGGELVPAEKVLTVMQSYMASVPTRKLTGDQ